MSKAEELLNSLSESVPMHSHPVPDTDTYFVIDPITRQIENTNRKKAVVMQYDHNSERFTFELPRYVDGHDMLQCTSVTVNCDNIESDTGTTNSDAPDMTDLRVHPNDPEKVISSWLISRNLTQLAGILSFSIEYKCVDTNGDVVYEWSTDIFDDVNVKARKKNGEAAVVEHTDLLEQWRTRIFGAGDSVMSDIAAEGEAQIAAVKEESTTQQEAVELKGAKALESIPEDYTETNRMASEALRSKADAIVQTVEGETIVATDSSNDYLRGLQIFGKSVQDGIPTPDAPVEIVDIAPSMVTAATKNLLNTTLAIGTKNGLTFTRNADNSITINGTATIMGMYTVGRLAIPKGSYVLSGCPAGGSGLTYDLRLGESGLYRDYGDGVSFTLTEPTLTDVSIMIRAGVTLDNLTFYPMVRLATELDAAYAPYIGKTIPIITTESLPGIPVTTGGNYTDENGQQWICDEIDFERGVYIQRIETTVLDGSENYHINAYRLSEGYYVYGMVLINPDKDDTPVLCDHLLFQQWSSLAAGNANKICHVAGSLYIYLADQTITTVDDFTDYLANNNITVMRSIGVPIETPLTVEEITAFKALKTNYPNTTILNDAGAWMSVKYNADTKSYVDKPKTLRLTDSSTGVVYELKVVDGAITVVPV